MASNDDQRVEEEIDCVEEIVKRDPSFIPQRYILNEEVIAKDVEILLHSEDFPILDLTLLSNGQEQELKKLDEACKDWGFFLLINHGITEEVLQHLKSAAAEFFKLPLEEKKKNPFDQVTKEGYGRPYPVSQDQTVDWSDSLMFQLYPARGRKLELWPNKPAQLNCKIYPPAAVEAYSDEIGKVTKSLLGSLSLIMGMEKDALLELHKEMLASMRMNYYPICCRPDKVLGLSPHSDPSTITILVQNDDVNGLQIRHDGVWVPVKPIPNSLIVNIGDVMEIWSNGKYKSIEHRAVTNGTRARISCAFFVMPQMQVEVEPLEQMLDATKQHRIYKKVKYEDYLKHSIQRRLEGKAHVANYAALSKKDQFLNVLPIDYV